MSFPRWLVVPVAAALAIGVMMAWPSPQLSAAQSTPARPAPAAADLSGSLLDRLPHPPAGGVAAAIAAARARGASGTADLIWLELFYGDAAQKKQAVAELHRALGAAGLAQGASSPALAFLQFTAASDEGSDNDIYQAALRLAQLAPDDVATELAARALSGGLDQTGSALLDATPLLRQMLERPLSDVTTAAMLGRPLLSAVRAPGVSLTLDQALALSGRIRPWQLYGPFGKWVNLGFDQAFPIETTIAATYADGDQTRRPQLFDNVNGEVQFPADWGEQGAVYAVTYLHADAPTPVAVRFYSEASARVWINQVSVVENDRRAVYTPSVVTAAAELPAGWSRVVVKLAGASGRDFDLVVRPRPSVHLDAAATLPPGAALAGAPQPLAAPPGIAVWAHARLATDPDDVVALWADGVRLLEDGDPEHARVDLERASRLVPAATPVWLSLADADSALPDASQSWAAAQVATAAQTALQTDPAAVRAQDRLAHVYESEGKTSEAATAYAACGGKGYADCDWSEFQLATRQHWTAEAAIDLNRAVAESGSDWNGMGQALDFYDSIGDAASTTACERVMSEDPRADAELGLFYLRHGEAAKAAPMLAAAAQFNPSSAAIRRQYLEALNRSDAPNAVSEAQRALQELPGDSELAVVADGIALRQSPAAGLTQLDATDFDRTPLHREADFLDDDRFWMPWYHSVADVIRDAPSSQDYPNASAVLVLDQMVDRINPDSSRDSYIHQVFRALNAAGVEQLGDQTITPGSDLLRVRTIKADGTILLPEKLANLQHISMPGLEAGDFVEVEYIMHTPPSPFVPGDLDNDMFFEFGDTSRVFHYSDYIILAPDNYPLKIDTHQFSNAPTVHSAGGWTSHEYLIQKNRVMISEPHMPPYEELVPRVWATDNTSWDDISRAYADHAFAVRQWTPEMRTQAGTLARGGSDIDQANAIFNWVAANVQMQPDDGDLFFAPARQFFVDRSGNRMAAFAGLLSAAGIPYQWVMARGVEDDTTLNVPSPSQFQYPLIRVVNAGGAAAGAGSDATAGWYDLNSGFAQLGYIASAYRGGLALVVGATGPQAFTHVPDGGSPFDGDVVTITGAVNDGGTAQVHIVMDFRGPNGDQIRDALNNQPSSQLPQIYQQLALSAYPTATATGGQVENMDDRQKSLIIDVDASLPDFVHQDGAGNWDIERLTSPVGLLQRYAQLPFRQHPLVINGESFEQMHVALTLPAKFVPGPLPPPENISGDFGRFTSNFSFAGGTIRLDREILLNANTIQPDQYPDFRTFAESADNQDRLRIGGTVKP